jgi:hypothetical protein
MHVYGTEVKHFVLVRDRALETFEETRRARLYFHMRIAANLSFQVAPSRMPATGSQRIVRGVAAKVWFQ